MSRQSDNDQVLDSPPFSSLMLFYQERRLSCDFQLINMWKDDRWAPAKRCLTPPRCRSRLHSYHQKGTANMYIPQCTMCCKDTDDSVCSVYFNSTKQSTLLSDGKICGDGICVLGICKVSIVFLYRLSCTMQNLINSLVKCILYNVHCITNNV